MMVDRQILEALQKGTTQAVLESSTPGLPVKYLGITFDPPNDQRYLECVFVPNNIPNQFWGRERTYQGVFRLLMHWDIDGMGYYPPMNALASIANYFNKERVLVRDGVRVGFTNEPDFGSVIEHGHELIFPASIAYRSFVKT